MLSRNPRRERAQWLAELRVIHHLGFNCVKTWVDWATAEPRPGVFDLQDLSQLLALAHQARLRVIVQLYADSAPSWVGHKFAHADFVTATGVRIHSESAPGYSFDNPGVRAAELQFYRRVARVASASPAFYGYDLWSEPHLVNWVWFNDLPHVQFDFSRYSRIRFRRWLRRKYGTLAALDRAWYRDYTRWNQVQPPRFGTILSYADFMDWRAFIVHELAADLGAMARAVDAVNPHFVTSSHSDIPGVLNTPLSGYGNPDDWKMAREVDYYGASIYPLHADTMLHGWPPFMRAFAFDGANAASRGKGFFIGEMQAGQGATGLRVNDPVTAAELRDWSWTAIGHGAKAICFYAWYPMNAGYESDGYGMIHLDGRLTRRARTAGAVARVVNRYRRLFHDAQPLPARIAILYNPLSYLSGGDTISPGRKIEHSMMGVYRALYRAHIPVTFLNADDLARGRTQSLKAIYLPYAITLSRAACRGLRRFVRHGGMAIAEARTAWNDARGFAYARIPGGGLAQVFSVREAALWPARHDTLTFSPEAPDGLAGLRVSARQFAESLQTRRGTVLAHFQNGQPAVVESHYGKGKTIFIGSFLGLAAFHSHPVPLSRSEAAHQPTPASAADRALRALARWAGIHARVKVTGGEARLVEVDWLRVPRVAMPSGQNGRLLIAINRGRPGTFTMTLPFRSAVAAKNLLNASTVPVKLHGSSAQIRLRLGHEDVAVLLLSHD